VIEFSRYGNEVSDTRGRHKKCVRGGLFSFFGCKLLAAMVITGAACMLGIILELFLKGID
jgi:hypothetical protein